MTDPFFPVQPGQPLLASEFNEMQKRIREEIDRVATARAGEITRVAQADDTVRLSGNTLDQLVALVADRVLDRIAAKQGYMRVFKVLRPGAQPVVVRHDLGRMPLVDVYRLDPFQVVATEDGGAATTQETTFFVHHVSEKRITPAGGQPVDIQPRGGTPWRIPFAAMLSAYHVDYSGSSSLGSVESDFWEAFNTAPNDDFGDDEYAHSPWFDRCCGENRTVAELESNGSWPDIVFQMRPRKTAIHGQADGSVSAGADTQEPEAGTGTAAPAAPGVGITHFGLDSVGLEVVGNSPADAGTAADTELPLMILLKI